MKQLYKLGFGVACALLTSAAPALAQTFTNAQAVAPATTSSGGSNVLEIVTDASGNSYVTGFFAGTVTIGGTSLTSVGGNDVFVAKYDAAGVPQWAVRGGGTGDDIANAITLDASGNVGIAGAYGGGAPATFGNTLLGNAGDLDMFVAKLSSAGTWQWAQRVSGASTELGQGVAFDSSGNLFAIGFYRSASITLSGTTVTYANPNATLAFSVLVKYSSAGAYLGSLNLSSNSSNGSVYANALAIDASNYLYLFGDFSSTFNLLGTTLTSTGGQDLFAARLTPSLTLSWASSAGGAADDFAPSGRALTVDASNNAYVTGRSYSPTLTFGSLPTLNNGTVNSEAFIASLGSTGTWRWAVRAGGSAEDQGEGVSLDGKGNLYATGNFQSTATFGATTLTSAGGFDAYVAKLTTAGTWLSANRAGGTLNDGGTGVASDVTGNLYNVGFYASSPASFSAFSLNNGGFQTGYFARSLADLLVSTPSQNIGGIYRNVTVASGGIAPFNTFLVVNGALTVQNGGILTHSSLPVTGAGSFALAPGGTLAIGDAAGIASTGATGAVQVSGSRTYAADATYSYGGPAAQVTGPGLPAQVRGLGQYSTNALTLSNPVSITQTLLVNNTGNLVTNGNALTLLSSSAGTALVINEGTGVVVGPVTVQRYISPGSNPATGAGPNPSGLGYRHYSSPVANTTVADLATSTFTPEVSQASAYNTSATPGTTQPFPTVFAYDQSRLSSTSNNSPVFDKGFVVPAGTGAALTPGQGYAVNLGTSELVDFVGTLNSGDLTVSLNRNSDATAADAGWALVGNPYPAPLDYSLVLAADRPNLDAAAYVFQSSGQYAGSYRSYVNGQSTGTSNNPLIASSQGFFVRVSQGQTSGSLTFHNSQRATSYASQATFQRSTADTRPLIRLELAGATLADAWVAYAEAGATPAFDYAYDATKLPNPTGLNLSSQVGSEQLSIDGRPVFTVSTVLPLAVGVPAAGTYSLTPAFANLPAGLTPYLLDAQTGRLVPLAAGSSYQFSVTAAEAQALLASRFSVQFSAVALATAPAQLAAQVSVYPNPARECFTVALPGVAGAATVQAELLNTLSQVVRYQQAALPATGTLLPMVTTGLAPGIYTLRLTAGTTVATKRVVVQ